MAASFTLPRLNGKMLNRDGWLGICFNFSRSVARILLILVPALSRELWANVSSMDHATSCQLGHLEEGNPDELVGQYVDIRADNPEMNVVGGCCGTDYVQVEKIG